ncbi:MAG: ShlB/FhaC/HecB family hemolysin secretion/activation protein, partial [Pseudomonadota bacterium]
MLRLNDLYGINFTSQLSKKNDGRNGTTVLTLTQDKNNPVAASIFANNHGSKFMGPYRTGASISTSLAAHQYTTFTALSSLPKPKEIYAFSINHDLQLTSDKTLNFTINRNQSEPGDSLKVNEIESTSFGFNLGFTWQAIRQRHRNLAINTKLDYLNTKTDSFGLPISNDRGRTLRLGTSFNHLNDFNTLTELELELSQGLEIFNANQPGEQLLSREFAKPYYTKLYSSLKRRHWLNDKFSLNYQIIGQVANKPLLSAEEFGFGGSNIGRAYDFSEITGDKGLAGKLELHYHDLKSLPPAQLIPYAFYDMGKVWHHHLTGN